MNIIFTIHSNNNINRDLTKKKEFSIACFISKTLKKFDYLSGSDWLRLDNLSLPAKRKYIYINKLERSVRFFTTWRETFLAKIPRHATSIKIPTFPRLMNHLIDID